MPWRIFGASTIGKGHIDGGLPCQDAFKYSHADDCIVAIVCDGAGSAAHSAIGARLCADEVCSALSSQTVDRTRICEGDEIRTAVATARKILDERAAELAVPTKELACTLVGVILYEDTGCFFHIGDGIAVAEMKDGTSLISSPENGEYANETFFVTADDWSNHLRLTPVSGSMRCIALMSDGAMPFAINRQKSGLFGPFIDPVIAFLTQASEVEGSEALEATLADERTWKITNDDKSLLLILPA